MDVNLLATFFLLVGLELVLGIDNILLISIITDRLPPEQRRKGRLLGLTLAFLMRCLLLLGASLLLKFSRPVLLGFSWKDMILILGGGFLLVKAVKEIHHVVEGVHSLEGHISNQLTFASAMTQIVLLDIVFSIDSVITAVGLTNSLVVIYGAVVLSFAGVLVFSGQIAEFVQKHPTLKILALAFLVTIGVTLCIEGFHGDVPKGYIYLPMGFALIVELLQLRFMHNAERRKARASK